MSALADHPAFDPARPRERQRDSLNDIRAVLPVDAAPACRAVWRAMQDPAGLPDAQRALLALPAAVQGHVNSMSRAIAR